MTRGMGLLAPLEDTFSDAGRVRGFLEAELKEGQGQPGWDRVGAGGAEVFQPEDPRLRGVEPCNRQ